MRRINFFISLSIITISCQKEVIPPVEPGVYEAYQQGFSEMITVTKSSYTGSDEIVAFKGMDERFKFPNFLDKLGYTVVEGSPIHSFYGHQPRPGGIRFVDVSEENEALEYILTVGENGKATFKSNYYDNTDRMNLFKIEKVYNITRKGDRISLSSTIKGEIIRFSPKFFQLSIGAGGVPPHAYDESLIVTSKDKDYGKYTTIQGKIEEETIILYFYDAQISGSSSSMSSYDINYLDMNRIREEMEQDEVLEFVRKAIYFRKKG